MARKDEHSFALIAVVGIVAIVALMTMFGTNRTGMQASGPDAVTAEMQAMSGEMNIGGMGGFAGCMQGRCAESADTHSCVCSNWLGCGGSSTARGYCSGCDSSNC